MVSLTTVHTPIGELRVAVTENGVARLALPAAEEQARFFAWIARHYPEAKEEETGAAAVRRELAEYFAGRRRAFSVSLDFQGTAFQRAVWSAVGQIPYGQTTTYTALARKIGRPQAVRAVGAANGANPIPIIIPCHRVIGTDGSLTGYAGGLLLKRRLLELEGVF
jgi:O-6-methylguanine DNA methyltransferase